VSCDKFKLKKDLQRERERVSKVEVNDDLAGLKLQIQRYKVTHPVEKQL